MSGRTLRVVDEVNRTPTCSQSSNDDKDSRTSDLESLDQRQQVKQEVPA